MSKSVTTKTNFFVDNDKENTFYLIVITDLDILETSYWLGFTLMHWSNQFSVVRCMYVL